MKIRDSLYKCFFSSVVRLEFSFSLFSSWLSSKAKFLASFYAIMIRNRNSKDDDGDEFDSGSKYGNILVNPWGWRWGL